MEALNQNRLRSIWKQYLFLEMACTLLLKMAARKRVGQTVETTIHGHSSARSITNRIYEKL